MNGTSVRNGSEGSSAESFNDALVDCVKSCGGSKVVGPLLWPAKSPDAAQRQLLDALSADRPGKLGPDEVLYLLRLARERGHHGGVGYLMAELGYAPPQPVEPGDRVAELQRRLERSLADQRALVTQIQTALDAMGRESPRLQAVRPSG